MTARCSLYAASSIGIPRDGSHSAWAHLSRLSLPTAHGGILPGLGVLRLRALLGAHTPALLHHLHDDGLHLGHLCSLGDMGLCGFDGLRSKDSAGRWISQEHLM